MKTDTDEKWTVCRVCLNNPSDANEFLQDIFSHNASTRLDQMLHICAGIPVSQDDNFPDRMCSKCVRCLRLAYKFRLTCQRSHQHITDMLAREAGSGAEYESLSLAGDLKSWEEDTSQLDIKLEEQLKVEEGHEDDQLVTYVVEDAIVFEAAGEDEPTEEIYETIQSEAEDPEANNFTEYEEFEVILPENSPAPAEEVALPATRSASNRRIHNTEVLQDEGMSDDIFSSDDPEYQVNAKPKAKTTRRKQTKKATAPAITTTDAINPEKKVGRKPRELYCSFICDVCGNIYPTQARLTEHMKFHLGIKPHECEICGRGFVQNQQLVRHMNTHTGKRPYKCNYCPAAFADRSTKTKHHRIHTKERPYECDVCSRTFTYSDNLKFHKMIHTGEKPHTCDICGKGFVKAYKMRLHRMTHDKRGIWLRTEPLTAGEPQQAAKEGETEFLS